MSFKTAKANLKNTVLKIKEKKRKSLTNVVRIQRRKSTFSFPCIPNGHKRILDIVEDDSFHCQTEKQLWKEETSETHRMSE